ncbi:MAG: hypothetical protein KDA44_17585 [Planctomycetales bacterium]|nr:hypothetical protein [Planctomycetales bacterium]
MIRRNGWVACIRVLACGCAVAFGGQAAIAVDYFWIGGTGDWAGNGNWDQGLSPEAQYEEVGIINNGGVATVSAAVPDSAGVILGQEEGDSGTLQVLSGGSINFVNSSGTPAGVANIGLNGTGVLDVRGGGSFSTTLLDVNAGSSVIIGSGAGSATVASTDLIYLNGVTTVHGAGHTFSAVGEAFLEGQSVYEPVIGASGVSQLSVGAGLTLGGRLNVQFSGGYVPSVGQSWDLFDAGSVAGAFANISAPTLPEGELYRVSTVAGGVNGKLVRLQLDAVLQLVVDWDSKSMSFSSPSGTVIDIDGYSILSNSGSLSVAQWNSLDDQNVSGWYEALPNSTSLNELNANAGGSLAVGSSPRTLGTPFQPVIGPFGTPTGDIKFEYATPSGEVVQGLVKYTGDRIVNNLLLTVDPATGEAQLKNSSLTTITIDGYSILSDSGSLIPGNGSWLSLDDQNEGGWIEAAPTANVLSELNPTGAATLLPGQGFSLGNLFDYASGDQDLELEFLFAGESEARTGAVLYGSIFPLATGDADFDDDGAVDGGDFLAWQRGFGIGSGAAASNGDANGDGAVNAADLAIWESQYGSSSMASATAIATPEPSSWLLAMAAVGAVVMQVRKRSLFCER